MDCRLGRHPLNKEGSKLRRQAMYTAIQRARPQSVLPKLSPSTVWLLLLCIDLVKIDDESTTEKKSWLLNAMMLVTVLQLELVSVKPATDGLT